MHSTSIWEANVKVIHLVFVYTNVFLILHFSFTALDLHGRKRTEANRVKPSDGGFLETQAMVLNGLCSLSEARGCSKQVKPH